MFFLSIAESVHFIDYEYSKYNYEHAEISRHFTEYAGEMIYMYIVVAFSFNQNTCPHLLLDHSFCSYVGGGGSLGLHTDAS